MELTHLVSVVEENLPRRQRVVPLGPPPHPVAPQPMPRPAAPQLVPRAHTDPQDGPHLLQQHAVFSCSFKAEVVAAVLDNVMQMHESYHLSHICVKKNQTQLWLTCKWLILA
jgi:hypothetical protein